MYYLTYVSFVCLAVISLYYFPYNNNKREMIFQISTIISVCMDVISVFVGIESNRIESWRENPSPPWYDVVYCGSCWWMEEASEWYDMIWWWAGNDGRLLIGSEVKRSEAKWSEEVGGGVGTVEGWCNVMEEASSSSWCCVGQSMNDGKLVGRMDEWMDG